MIAARLEEPDDFAAWRDLARGFAARGIAPEDIVWQDADNGPRDLFASSTSPTISSERSIRTSRAFLDVARMVLLHRDPARLDLLYRVLWRMQERPRLLEDRSDPDVAVLERLAKVVRRDVHKMRAFVRFRSVVDQGADERYVAWFEPEHRIERYNARFFLDRFASQHWSILTPRMSLHWNGDELTEGPGMSRNDAPADDAAEELWLAYYRSIFNPGRLKVGAMVKEMPRKYWKNLPEAAAIPGLIAGAQKRETEMIETGAALFEDGPPETLQAISQGIAVCRRCPIGCNGTRAVMGEGPRDARLMIVGEQPGDTEESEGRPFVGPAGQLLDAQLERAGIDRSAAYVTNAVKHFKFVQRGKRRLHQSPTAGEIDICRWWLDAERALVRPEVVLVLGASGGRGTMGRTPAIGRERGLETVQADGSRLWLTAHPSYLLRLEGEAREREERRFLDDLLGLARLLETQTA